MKPQNTNMDFHRCILYYPTISIPTGNWLRQSLLYWDEIGSIVTHSYIENTKSPYSPDIQFLEKEGQFRAFWADECILRQGYDVMSEFEKEFKIILATPRFQHRIYQLQPIQLSSRIHRDKISSELFQYLQEIGLAKEESYYSEWYMFEDNTALLYMAVLAKYIADNDMQATIPGTDRREYENFIFQARKEAESIACFSVNFMNALPVPRDDIPLSDIVAFKHKRRNELLNFRQTLDELQMNLRKCTTKEEVNQILVSYKERTEKGISDLQEILDDSRIATKAGTIKTLISLNSPTFWTALSAPIISTIIPISTPWVIAGAVALSAINVGSYLLDMRNKQRAEMRNNPFSYLVRAREKYTLR